ncbi:MAG: hypothetical protein WC969_11535 [Elusimicrobiota bacterium]|jgi:Spy/CpxP family protein refolding chaperone
MKLFCRHSIPLFILGLLLGAALGSWGHRAAVHRFMRPPEPGRMIDHLSRELKLDAEQQEAVRAVFEARRGQAEKMRRDNEARFEVIRVEVRAELAKVLRPEQLARFDELAARRERRMRRGDPFGPRGTGREEDDRGPHREGFPPR